jgi:hypothetical protein
MGIDYSFSLAVGFVVDMDALLKPFAKVTKGKSHMEDRFDPKTGEKLEPVKVVDRGHRETYSLDGKRFGTDRYDFLEALGVKLDCTIDDGGGYSDEQTAYVSVNFESDHSEDYDRVTINGRATLDEVVRCKEKCEALRKTLSDLGMEGLGEALVYISPNVS